MLAGVCVFVFVCALEYVGVFVNLCASLWCVSVFRCACIYIHVYIYFSYNTPMHYIDITA